MIERLLPAEVVAVEARADDVGARLFAEEEQAVARAVEGRRREFATGRACARAALAGLGLPPAPIPAGPRGEPCWPDGVVGSITHCQGYRACAVARSDRMIALGIDAEPNAPLPDGLLVDIARAEELALLDRLRGRSSAVRWDRLLFSAKESVYKAWFPLARRWLGFEDASLVVSPEGTFAARLLVEGPSLEGGALQGGAPEDGGLQDGASRDGASRDGGLRDGGLRDGALRGFAGRWAVAGGTIVTAVALSRRAAAGGA